MRESAKTIRNLCIYCGASLGNSPHYAALARRVAMLCAQTGTALVYGGGRVGLMGVLADAALQAGGQVTGVIPEDLQKREIAHEGLTRLYVTKSIHERQNLMTDLSDAFLMLPGGMGTLAEFFEALTWKQLGYHDKPIFILNAGGYWDSVLQGMEHARGEGFIHREDKRLYTILADVQALKTHL